MHPSTHTAGRGGIGDTYVGEWGDDGRDEQGDDERGERGDDERGERGDAASDDGASNETGSDDVSDDGTSGDDSSADNHSDSDRDGDTSDGDDSDAGHTPERVMPRFTFGLNARRWPHRSLLEMMEPVRITYHTNMARLTVGFPILRLNASIPRSTVHVRAPVAARLVYLPAPRARDANQDVDALFARLMREHGLASRIVGDMARVIAEWVRRHRGGRRQLQQRRIAAIEPPPRAEERAPPGTQTPHG